MHAEDIMGGLMHKDIMKDEGDIMKGRLMHEDLIKRH